MTKQELERLKALCEKATPGPWKEYECGEEEWCVGSRWTGPAFVRIPVDNPDLKADAEFIAAARTAVPELIAEIDKHKSLLQKAMEKLKPRYFIRGRLLQTSETILHEEIRKALEEE